MKTIVAQEHIHIDNGGTSFELIDDPDAGVVIEISDSYFGYSESKLSLFAIVQSRSQSPEYLRKIGSFFFRAAEILEIKYKK